MLKERYKHVFTLKKGRKQKLEEFYVKETKIIEVTEEEKKNAIISSIKETKRNLDIAHKNFEFADKDLIDYYSYQIKANSSKLDYLTKIAKSKGIVKEITKIIGYN